MNENTLLIHDSTPFDDFIPKDMGRGFIPRDFKIHPIEMFSPPSEMKTIPRSEWDARIDEQEAQQSSLEHIRLQGNNGQSIPSLNQGSYPICWANSTTHAAMLNRAAANLPYVRLSAFGMAAKIKKFHAEGGWCGLSAAFARDTGIPADEFFPQQTWSRSNDNDKTWASAALHKITQDWIDLTRPVYEDVMTFDQVATCLLLNQPCALDFSYWSHSVCGIRLVRIEKGSYGIKIWNSWGDEWSDRGMGILQGNRAIPDNAIAIRATTASAS